MRQGHWLVVLVIWVFHEKGGKPGCRAHLGSPGHDFSTRPLLCYSFFQIECPNRDF
jgi:hypothetical protein